MTNKWLSETMTNKWLRYSNATSSTAAAVRNPWFQVLFAVTVVQRVQPNSSLLQVLYQSAKYVLAGRCLYLTELVPVMLKEFLDYNAHIAQTSQVCATRFNLQERRQCLQFAARWHKCTVQSAYSLWQRRLLQVPPCPASQRFHLPTGAQMSILSQSIADRDGGLPIQYYQLLGVDKILSVARGKELMAAVGKYRFSAVEESQRDQARELVNDFKRMWHETNQLDFQAFPEHLSRFVDYMLEAMVKAWEID